MDKTLDEALDEFDRWGEAVSAELETMTSEQRVAYFAETMKRVEEQTGIKLNLKRVPAPEKTFIES